MPRYTFKVQYGTYTGTESADGEDAEQAEARMWARLSRDGWLTLPMAHRSARVIGVEEDDA